MQRFRRIRALGDSGWEALAGLAERVVGSGEGGCWTEVPTGAGCDTVLHAVSRGAI